MSTQLSHCTRTGPKRSIKQNDTSVAGKCGLLWQPKEHIVFGNADTEPESEGIAELSGCQDTPISGAQNCDDIRAV